MKNFTFIAIFCCLSFFCLAEETDYWQQKVDYTISVGLDDKNHELNGFIEMNYQNNSPETLDFIIIHLWPNAYKNDETAFAKQFLENGNKSFYNSKSKDKGEINELQFKQGTSNLTFDYHPQHIDICTVRLAEPIAPGKSTVISTPFRVKIPISVSRLGHTGQVYNLTQWYPKPAVYDKNGWNPMPYLDQGEFYSEFGTFEVDITLPENYVVGATGKLQNESEIEWLNEKAKATAALDSFPQSITTPTSSQKTKTLSYIAENVHDFAWFADKNFNVVKGRVYLPKTKREITIWSMFSGNPRTCKKWQQKSVKEASMALKYFSEYVGEYPYPQQTLVTNPARVGSMEYPMATITAFDAIIHEVGHNWFYGILAFNERTHPNLDEGFNTFYEELCRTRIAKENWYAGLIQSFWGRSKGLHNASENKINTLGVRHQCRQHLDQPMSTNSAKLTYNNYYYSAYAKPPTHLYHLMYSIGEKEFHQIMQSFYDKWKFKHPAVEDIKKHFEENSTKDNDWFFDQLLPTTDQIDYKLAKLKLKGETIGSKNFDVLTIKNKGKIRAPFSIGAMRNDSIVKMDWYGGVFGEVDINFPSGEYDKYVIDPTDVIPESVKSNNTLKTKGPFKWHEPLQIGFIGKVENPNRSQIFVGPAIGWNNYDKTMLGLAIHNITFPNKKFEFELAPMFAFGSQQFAGLGNLSYHTYPAAKALRKITYSVGGKTFNNNYSFKHDYYTRYAKLSPRMDIFFNPKEARSLKRNKLLLKADGVQFEQANFANGSFVDKEKKYQYFTTIRYNWSNNRTINPFGFEISNENGWFLKQGAVYNEYSYGQFSATFNYKFSYPKGSKGVNLRLFGASYINNDLAGLFTSELGLSQNNGSDHNLKDDLYFGRSDQQGIWSQQVGSNQNNAGFKSRSFFTTDEWIASLNLSVDLPVDLPLSFYLNIASYANAKQLNVVSGGDPVVYELGASFPIVEDVFEIYMPLIVSKDLQVNIADLGDDDFEQIVRSVSFYLNFGAMKKRLERDYYRF